MNKEKVAPPARKGDSPKDNTTTIAAALTYAAIGWPVFPCVAGGKNPLTAHGFKNASTDPERIREWWARWPSANVAIATGAPGPDVFDVEGPDKPAGCGFPALDRLREAGLVPVAERYVTTPSLGWHLYYPGTEQPCRTELSKTLHVEIRATGGYVLAPPSVVGRRYRLVSRCESTGALDWSAVVALLRPTPPPAPASNRRRDAGIGRGPIAAYNAVTAWADLLPRLGWTEHPHGWLRPGKDRGQQSATVGPDGRLYVYSSSVDWAGVRPDGRPCGYSPFDVLAAAEYGGNRTAALHAAGRAVKA